jgi:uncharacterized membrane protein
VSQSSRKRQQRARTQAPTKAGARQPARSTALREQKRAQFTSPRKKNVRVIVGGVAIVIIAIAVMVFIAKGGGGQSYAQAATAAGDVKIPVAQVNDGKAHFFSMVVNGTKVRYFVLASPDGTVRAALDACEVCYAQKKGYHQEGNYMVCNNCGKRFRSDQINVITGGCNPIPLQRTVAGGTLTISTADIQAGAQYF